MKFLAPSLFYLIALFFLSSNASASSVEARCSNGGSITVDSSTTSPIASCAGIGSYTGSFGRITTHDTSASVNLADGSIGLSASHGGVANINSAAALGQMSDTVHLVGGSGVITVNALFTVEGSFNPGVLPLGGEVLTDVRFQHPGNLAVIDRAFSTIGIALDGSLELSSVLGNVTPNLLDKSFSIQHNISYDIDLSVTRDLSLYGSVRATSFDGTTEVTNAAFSALDLPEGVSFTSDSGVFLTNSSTSTVPIPAAAWLFGSAVIGLVGWRRRKS